MRQAGQVRVGTCRFEGSKRIDPSYPGFTNIVCLTPSTAYGMLSPYCLTVRIKFSKDLFPPVIVDSNNQNLDQRRDEEFDCLVECAYQFSKVYPSVDDVIQTKSRFDRTVIWKWPAQVHLAPSPQNPNERTLLTPEYLQWRKAGMIAKDPIRYPVGPSKMNTCAFSLAQTEDGKLSPYPLDYVASRKAIYLPLYVKAVKSHPEFAKLKERLLNGENLLIIEVDGPQSRSLSYYQQTYGVRHDFIENDTILVTRERLNILINDGKERYGHGYCLAGSLLDIY